MKHKSQWLQPDLFVDTTGHPCVRTGICTRATGLHASAQASAPCHWTCRVHTFECTRATGLPASAKAYAVAPRSRCVGQWHRQSRHGLPAPVQTMQPYALQSPRKPRSIVRRTSPLGLTGTSPRYPQLGHSRGILHGVPESVQVRSRRYRGGGSAMFDRCKGKGLLTDFFFCKPFR